MSPIEIAVEKVVNEGVSGVAKARAERKEGFPFTYILRDGQQENIVNNIRIRGLGITRPVSNTIFRLRMGSELYFIDLFADLLDEMAHTGVWGGLLTPTHAVMYEFERPMILTPGTPLTYETVLGTNTTDMNLFLRGEIISKAEAKRTLTYLRTYELKTTGYTLIDFPRNVYVLSLLFYDILEKTVANVTHYTIVNPANVAEYNQLASYICEVFVKEMGQTDALSYGIDRWCNYSVEYIHKKHKFIKPPLLRAETDQLLVKLNADPVLGSFTPEKGTWKPLVKLNADPVLGSFTPEEGTWKPQVTVEYKIAPKELGTYR